MLYPLFDENCDLVDWIALASIFSIPTWTGLLMLWRVALGRQNQAIGLGPWLACCVGITAGSRSRGTLLKMLLAHRGQLLPHERPGRSGQLVQRSQSFQLDRRSPQPRPGMVNAFILRLVGPVTTERKGAKGQIGCER